MRSASITSRYCECQTREECDRSAGCKRHYINSQPKFAAQGIPLHCCHSHANGLGFHGPDCLRKRDAAAPDSGLAGTTAAGRIEGAEAGVAPGECEDARPGDPSKVGEACCACGEINTRHCPVHGNQPTHDWFSVQAGFWRSIWLVLRGGRLREWKWLTEDEVRASGVYLPDEEFFTSLEETT